jgi:hypothetical protein
MAGRGMVALLNCRSMHMANMADGGMPVPWSGTAGCGDAA